MPGSAQPSFHIGPDNDAFDRGISLDPNVYAEPDSFDPERFLPKPIGRGEPPLRAAFGYGRMCGYF
jgi:hypothetical protein